MFVERWSFGTDGSYGFADVEWFEAPPGAAWYTGLTPFRSLDWIAPEDLPFPGPGPVHKRQSKYRKGRTIPGYAGTGPVCGPADQWENGVPSPIPPAPNRDDNGVPECCSGKFTAEAHFDGSFALVWSAFETPPPYCQGCLAFSGNTQYVRDEWPFPPVPGGVLFFGCSWNGSSANIIAPPDWVQIGDTVVNGELALGCFLLPSVPLGYTFETWFWDGPVSGWSVVMTPITGVTGSYEHASSSGQDWISAGYGGIVTIRLPRPLGPSSDFIFPQASDTWVCEVIGFYADNPSWALEFVWISDFGFPIAEIGFFSACNAIAGPSVYAFGEWRSCAGCNRRFR